MANSSTIYLINDTHFFVTLSEAVAVTFEQIGYIRVTKATYRRHAVNVRRAKRRAERRAAFDAETEVIAAEAVAEAIAIIRDAQRGHDER